MQTSEFLSAVIRGDLINPGAFSEQLHITQAELANTIGVTRETISKKARQSSQTVQSRLRDMAEIMNRVAPWTGSTLASYAWYRSQSLPSFGDATAEQLVRDGMGEAVKDYLDRIAAGGYA
jgi:transcriptional regulator with XRE-family HTH domain